MFKLNIKNNKKEEEYYFIMIDYSDEAYDSEVAHDSLKKMYHIHNGRIVNVEDYTPALERMYKRYGYVIIDVTEGETFPRMYAYRNVNKEVLGRLEL